MTEAPGQRRRRLVPPLLIGLCLLALLGAILAWRGEGPARAGQSVEVPGSLAGLPLSDRQVGLDAIDNVTRLHGQSFALETGAVGTYRGDRGSATLWVTGTAERRTAADMVVAMRDRIDDSQSPFTLIGERQEGGRTIYELEGLGQRHFTFQAGPLVIWLAADAPLAEQALRETLAFYGRTR